MMAVISGMALTTLFVIIWVTEWRDAARHSQMLHQCYGSADD